MERDRVIGGWPTSEAELERFQLALAAARSEPWWPSRDDVVAGVWFVAPTGSAGDTAGEPAWVAAAALRDRLLVGEALVRGSTGAGYRAGYLALREGPLLERAVRALEQTPDVVLVNATGRDHPRGAGLAVHLGAVLGRPTVGVTDRPLAAATPDEPGPSRGERVPLILEGVEVGALVRTHVGARPVAVHPGWRMDLATAVGLALAVPALARTPEPLRRARRLARLARAADEGRLR